MPKPSGLRSGALRKRALVGKASERHGPKSEATQPKIAAATVDFVIHGEDRRIIGEVPIQRPSTAARTWISFRDDFQRSPVDKQIDEIRKGVKASYLFGFAQAAQVPQEYACRLVGLPFSTAKRKLAKDENLDALVTERLTRIGGIEKQAEETFGSVELANAWLRANNTSLGNVPPIALLDTEIGCRQVARVLNAIAYGGTA